MSHFRAEVAARLVLDHSPDCIKLVDPNGCLAWVNARACQLLEVSSPDVLIGRPWVALWPEQVRARVAQAMADARRGSTGRFTGPCPTFAGTPKWWDVIVIPIEDGGSEGPLLLSISRDVTDLLIATEEARAAAAAAEWARAEAERARAEKEQLLGAVSHELRSPLQAILTWAVMLQAETNDPAADAIGLQIETLAMEQVALVDELIDDHRRGSAVLLNALEPVLLGQLARDAVESMRPLLESSRRQVDFDTGQEATVTGDVRRLRQVFVNLLSNAMKFTGVNGRIVVSCSAADGMARVAVRDDGVGVPQEFEDRIFEPYFQVQPDDSGTGLGLGLYLARMVIELHGGTLVLARNDARQGSTFVVSIPIAAATSEQLRARAS